MEGVARVVDTRDLTTEWGGEGRGGAGGGTGRGRVSAWRGETGQPGA